MNKILKVVTRISELNKLIKAYELLFDRKPIIKIKGELVSAQWVEYLPGKYDYVKVDKVTQRLIYIDHIGYHFLDSEKYFIELNSDD